VREGLSLNGRGGAGAGAGTGAGTGIRNGGIEGLGPITGTSGVTGDVLGLKNSFGSNPGAVTPTDYEERDILIHYHLIHYRYNFSNR
jgi:hypothetical protein